MFDKKVMRDGRENSYEFFKDGKCYKLTPMHEDGGSCNKEVHNCNSSIMLCSTKEFLKEKERSEGCFNGDGKLSNVVVKMEESEGMSLQGNGVEHVQSLVVKKEGQLLNTTMKSDVDIFFKHESITGSTSC